MKLLHQIVLQSKYEEVEKVEGFLNKLQHELRFDDELYAKLMLSVSEAVTNSIVHGNKLDENKQVKLKAYYKKAESELVFECSDEGEGFNPNNIPNPVEEENLLKTSGRGLFLMKEYADAVSYSKNGTKVNLVFKL